MSSQNEESLSATILYAELNYAVLQQEQRSKHSGCSAVKHKTEMNKISL